MGYLLSQVEGNKVFLSLQPEFLAAACSDDFIAGLLLNYFNTTLAGCFNLITSRYISEVVCNKALPVQQELKARIAYNLQQQQQLEMQFATETQQT